MKSQYFSLQPETSRVWQMSPLGSVVMGGVRVEWERLACSLMVLSSSQSWQQPDLSCLTSVSPHLSQIGHSMHLLLREDCFCLPPFLRAAENVLYTPDTHCYCFFWDPQLEWESEGRQAGRPRGFTFCLAILAAKPQLPHLHVCPCPSPWF